MNHYRGLAAPSRLGSENVKAAPGKRTPSTGNKHKETTQ